MTEDRLAERMRRLSRNHPFRTLDPWAAALKDGADEIDRLRARLEICDRHACCVISSAAYRTPAERLAEMSAGGER